MTLLTTIAGLGAAATLAALAVPASAAPSAPVNVTACSYSTLRGGGALLTPGFPSLNNGSLDVTFVNEAPVAAKSVTLDVSYGGTIQTVRETGTFAPGTPIAHTFFATANPNNGPAACTVRSVTFGDGTVWQAI